MKVQQLGGLSHSAAFMEAGCMVNLGGQCASASGTADCLKLVLLMQQCHVLGQLSMVLQTWQVSANPVPLALGICLT